ncbi:MBL fold metallo-hydrolase [Ohtaekwangia kribbensis]|jgi:hydroxyacylglutathione hydrolase|uniref:MBL fold metallo-hydrolase n=1 Tax=Ohtaekwangia kribbensis TaxID=688913 RepID=A0ABW3K3P9_9BACT
MLQLQSFVFNPLQENTYVLFDETKECVIIDPGCYEREEQYDLADFIETNQLKVVKLLNTHGHVDHVLGNAFVKETYKTKLYIHEQDAATLKAVKVYAPHYGFFQYQEAEPDIYLKEGEAVTFGNQSLDVLFVPGHAPGHIAFYHAASKTLIGGDVLFYNSIGRTDLPGGNYDTLIDSIHQKLFTLPDDVTVYPGHGPETTIGYEKKTNPFCAL